MDLLLKEWKCQVRHMLHSMYPQKGSSRVPWIFQIHLSASLRMLYLRAVMYKNKNKLLKIACLTTRKG